MRAVVALVLAVCALACNKRPAQCDAVLAVVDPGYAKLKTLAEASPVILGADEATSRAAYFRDLAKTFRGDAATLAAMSIDDKSLAAQRDDWVSESKSIANVFDAQAKTLDAAAANPGAAKPTDEYHPIDLRGMTVVRDKILAQCAKK